MEYSTDVNFVFLGRWLAAVAIGLVFLAAPSQASADAWTPDYCANAGFSAPNATVCVKGYMGSKNTTNRTQWVGKVRVFTKCGSCTSAGTKRLEAWGDGFYKSASYSTRYVNNDVIWTINRWVRSGTNICGARTFLSGYPRAIACFSIKV